MKKLFENWRGFINETEEETLREPVPEYLFPNARQDMLKAYEEGGINRQVFINKIERELMPILTSAGVGGPLSSVGIYEKFIFPQILKTIHETPVEIMGEFPCGEEEKRDVALYTGPRTGGHHDPTGKPNFPNAFHKGRGGAGRTKIYMSCGYLAINRRNRRAKSMGTAPAARIDGNFDHEYDKKGHRAYDVFRHEMMHAIDFGLALPKQGDLASWTGTLKKWFKKANWKKTGWRGSKTFRARARGLSKRQKNIIGLIFPVTLSQKKGKGHSERGKEIYTNIVDLRSRLGRPYQAEDIAKLKKRNSDLVGMPPGVTYQARSDLMKALSKSVNQDLTDQEIANLLNQVAAADKIKRPPYMKQVSLTD